MKYKILFILFLFIYSNMFSQTKDEHIADFDATIKIRKDGSLLIRERIQVLAQGDKIKKGIIRELPLKRKDKDGKDKKLN